jgi:hypothetical protein
MGYSFGDGGVLDFPDRWLARDRQTQAPETGSSRTRDTRLTVRLRTGQEVKNSRPDEGT